MFTRNWVLINPHQGLGDHLVCVGIYQEYARKYAKVFITVSRKYLSELTSILGDVNNITLVALPTNHLSGGTRFTQRLARLLKIRVVGLGGYGADFLKSEMRFDQNFYYQAEVDFECRWSSFSSHRNIMKEEQLFRYLNCNDMPYIFVHEDKFRGFTINRNLLPKNLRIVQPQTHLKGYSLIDYRKVIEGASEIHVIESSFAAYIESLVIPVPLFAHRYARPETYKDCRHEFTYKKDWKIFN